MNEHNMSVGLISLVPVFSGLSWTERYFVRRIVDKHSLQLVRYN